MYSKIFIIKLFFFLLIITSVSRADVSVLESIVNNENTVHAITDRCMKKGSSKKEFKYESIRKLENDLKSGIDDISFPVLFSKYINVCMRLNDHKRAKDFFLTLATENPTSPHALTAKGIVTYGWWAKNVLRHGLKKIDKAISLDKKAFFPKLCRATYLSYLPEEFTIAVNEMNALLETEKDNPSNLAVVYSNLLRIYEEHGHYDLETQINETLLQSQSYMNKKIKYSYTDARSHNNNKYNREIAQTPYPIINNINSKKAHSTKDKQLNEHLAILEKSMERRLDNATFGDIYQRYILLTWQYGETNRAIRFFDDLAKRYPSSPNALAASGTISYGWRGQMLLQKGLDCIKEAVERDNSNFFSRISHATFVAYFPNGFKKSMYELSLLRQSEASFQHRLSLINNRISLICSQHGHDRVSGGYKESLIKRRI